MTHDGRRQAILAIDTATTRVVIATGSPGGVADGLSTWTAGYRHGETLLPSIGRFLGEQNIRRSRLSGIVVGTGPGAFTGLRVACAVAQGLALGAAKPVLPIDTLLAVAEDARGDASALRVWVAMDARMDEVYAAEYAHADGRWEVATPPALWTLDSLDARWRERPPTAIAGTALKAFAGRLSIGAASTFPDALPRAGGMLRLAAVAWADGDAVDPLLALPLYLRMKVAQTMAERAAGVVV